MSNRQGIKLPILTSKYDLDLCHRVIDLVNDMPTLQSNLVIPS